jgi:ketosteroid isomerase-like protein
MSQQNVELARAAFAAWNAGDMTAYRELCHPDVIGQGPADWPEPGPFVGRDAVMHQWEQQRETWGDADVAEPISEFIDAGDQVAVRHIWRATGHGPEMSMEITVRYTFREGRIFRLDYFWDYAAVLATMGLSE